MRNSMETESFEDIQKKKKKKIKRKQFPYSKTIMISIFLIFNLYFRSLDT